MTKTDEHLDKLFAAYREACPDPEPSGSFMPEIWNKIEARRRFTINLKRWTSAFVTAAAALCIAMTIFMPQPAQTPVFETTYIDTLGANEPYETMAYAELVRYELSEGLNIQ